MVSIFFICISVIMFCLKTYPNFRNPVLLPRNVSIKETHKQTEYDFVWAEAVEEYKRRATQRQLAARRSVFDDAANESDAWLSREMGSPTPASAAAVWPPPANASDDEWPQFQFFTKKGSDEHEAFFYVECVCNAWFIFEICVRLACTPSRAEFYRSPLNIIDIIATSSFVCDTTLFHLFSFDGIETIGDVLEFFSIIRIMRLFKLTKHSPGVH